MQAGPTDDPGVGAVGDIVSPDTFQQLPGKARGPAGVILMGLGKTESHHDLVATAGHACAFVATDRLVDVVLDTGEETEQRLGILSPPQQALQGTHHGGHLA
ncbi:hypothetical protein FV139_10795 [Parahaliea maris]|uniref:Uncharacterized protein n=1 Tax=Parahaliea maris TaxID=2716870 RepID=A0A5C9A002_9GAMM|nr:hypothetical protein FV139_10795 [Parahaliea maris]